VLTFATYFWGDINTIFLVPFRQIFGRISAVPFASKICPLLIICYQRKLCCQNFRQVETMTSFLAFFFAMLKCEFSVFFLSSCLFSRFFKSIKSNNSIRNVINLWPCSVLLHQTQRPKDQLTLTKAKRGWNYQWDPHRAYHICEI